MPKQYVPSRYGNERDVKTNIGDANEFWKFILGGGGQAGQIDNPWLFGTDDRLGYMGRRGADLTNQAVSQKMGVAADAMPNVGLGSGVVLDPMLKAELGNILAEGGMAQDWGLESIIGKLGLDEQSLMSLYQLLGSDRRASQAVEGQNQAIWDEINGLPSSGMAALQGGASGATTGASIGGPIGAGIGGFIGAVTGLFGNKDKKKKLKKLLREDNRLIALMDELDLMGHIKRRAMGEEGGLTPEMLGTFKDWVGDRINAKGNVAAKSSQERLLNTQSPLAAKNTYMKDTLDEIARTSRHAGRGAVAGLREGVNRELPKHQAAMQQTLGRNIGAKREYEAGASLNDPTSIRSGWEDFLGTLGAGGAIYGSLEKNRKPKADDAWHPPMLLPDEPNP